jgi:hypothetical protein
MKEINISKTAKRLHRNFVDGVTNSLESKFAIGVACASGVFYGAANKSVKVGLQAAITQYLGGAALSGVFNAIAEEIVENFGS